jgi:hypothetical protein
MPHTSGRLRLLLCTARKGRPGERASDGRTVEAKADVAPTIRLFALDGATDYEEPTRPGCVGFCIVADTGLVAALPLSLSATPSRTSDRRRDEARRDRSFLEATLSA